MFVFIQGFAPFFPLLVPTVQVELIFQIDFNKVSCTCAIAFPFQRWFRWPCVLNLVAEVKIKRKLLLNSPSIWPTRRYHSTMLIHGLVRQGGLQSGSRRFHRSIPEHRVQPINLLSPPPLHYNHVLSCPQSLTAPLPPVAGKNWGA